MEVLKTSRGAAAPFTLQFEAYLNVNRQQAILFIVTCNQRHNGPTCTCTCMYDYVECIHVLEHVHVPVQSVISSRNGQTFPKF